MTNTLFTEMAMHVIQSLTRAALKMDSLTCAALFVLFGGAEADLDYDMDFTE